MENLDVGDITYLALVIFNFVFILYSLTCLIYFITELEKKPNRQS